LPYTTSIVHEDNATVINLQQMPTRPRLYWSSSGGFRKLHGSRLCLSRRRCGPSWWTSQPTYSIVVLS